MPPPHEASVLQNKIPGGPKMDNRDNNRNRNNNNNNNNNRNQEIDNVEFANEFIDDNNFDNNDNERNNRNRNRNNNNNR